MAAATTKTPRNICLSNLGPATTLHTQLAHNICPCASAGTPAAACIALRRVRLLASVNTMPGVTRRFLMHFVSHKVCHHFLVCRATAPQVVLRLVLQRHTCAAHGRRAFLTLGCGGAVVRRGTLGAFCGQSIAAHAVACCTAVLDTVLCADTSSCTRKTDRSIRYKPERSRSVCSGVASRSHKNHDRLAGAPDARSGSPAALTMASAFCTISKLLRGCVAPALDTER